MKIEGNRPNFDPTIPGAVDLPDTAKAPAAASPAAGHDNVRVSGEAQLATSAISAAQQAPDIRPEAVARGRKLLDAGELGADPTRLADALIDRAIGR